jgi:hypothetical protein
MSLSVKVNLIEIQLNALLRVRAGVNVGREKQMIQVTSVY